MAAKQSESVAKTGVVFRREDCAGFWLRLLVDVVDFFVAGIVVLVVLFPLLLLSPDDDRLQIRMFFLLVLAILGGINFLFPEVRAIPASSAS
jgi:hypothetical protein